MRWQRLAQFAIAAFVVVFIAVLAVSMRRNKPAPPPADAGTPVPGTGVLMFNPQGGEQSWTSNGRKVFDFKFGSHVALTEGRHEFSKGVKVITNRNGKDLTITADSALVSEKGGEFQTAVFKKDVHLVGEGGLDVRTEEATYAESDGIVKMPGAVSFAKGRLRGNGVGATYDMNREVLWLQEKATFNVAADDAGQGAMEGSAGSIGLARLEHYVRLIKDAHINGEGRDMRADEITITLTPDDERVQMLQLRGTSRMTGGASGPQAMSAKDIDVTYAEDGRTLQHANLMENAVLQLAPGEAGGSGKRISGKTIAIGMAPDGKTVTNLTSTENVQVDLPAEGTGPAKRIRAAALVANGAPDVGLKTASFTGKVTYQEIGPARRNQPAANRTATAESLNIDTKPGLGAVEKADFRGNVEFTELPDVTAVGQRGIYYLERDRIELMPADGVPGPPARVADGKISVQAKTIEFTLGTRDMIADTKVRSTLITKASGRGQATKVPSVLKANEPVNVTANRLQYQGTASKAVYSGSVQLWQDVDKDGATIKGDTLTLDDKTGNLEVVGNAVTDFMLEETDKTTGVKKRTRTIGSARTFVFDDKRRLGTYTERAQLNGPQGELTAHKIEVFLKPGANEVERLEAYAQGTDVRIKDGKRRSYGTHLTYTASDDQYLMIGTPVESIEAEDDGVNCRVAKATSMSFQRGEKTAQMTGNRAPVEVTGVKCATLKR